MISKDSDFHQPYLVWMRSAIALMGFGVLIARLRMFQPPVIPSHGNGWKLGLVFSVVGLITVWLTTQYYFVVRHDIDEDIYETADRGVITFSLSMLILGADVVFTSLLSP